MAYRIRQGREASKVMCRDEYKTWMLNKLFYKCNRSRLFISGIRSFQNFIEQDQKWFFFPELIHNRLQPVEFCIEITLMFFQRICCAHPGSYINHRTMEFLSTYRSATQRQHHVHTQRTKKSTLSRHVCSCNDHDRLLTVKVYIIHDPLRFIQQRMT